MIIHVSGVLSDVEIQQILTEILGELNSGPKYNYNRLPQLLQRSEYCN